MRTNGRPSLSMAATSDPNARSGREGSSGSRQRTRSMTGTSDLAPRASIILQPGSSPPAGPPARQGVAAVDPRPGRLVGLDHRRASALDDPGVEDEGGWQIDGPVVKKAID